MIKFIHAADLHLDTPFSGLEQTSKEVAEKLRAAPYESLANMVDLAIEEAVDFVLLAGDVYNTKRVNIQAQSLFIEQLNRLREAGIQVFLIRGNHDFLTDEDKTLMLPLPENVYTYQADVATHTINTKENKRVAVTGFSYETQWVHERKIKDYPKRQSNVDLHIGMLHGSAEGVQTTEANYAPFTLAELREKNYDYWALGHIHQRQQLAENPLAYYAGNIQGLHKNETGQKGCLLIEWTDHEHHIQFIPTAPIIWESLNIDISEVENFQNLFEILRREMMQFEEKEEVLVSLTLNASGDYNEKLVSLMNEPDFKEQLTKQIDLQNIWIASLDFILEETANSQTLEKMYPEMWQTAKSKALEPSGFNEITESIFSQIPSKYMNETNTKDYRERMIEKAIGKIYLK